MKINHTRLSFESVFPLLGISDGVIVSKRGDVTLGWEVSLPASYSVAMDDYDRMLTSLQAAARLLPDWTIIHKQDLFLRSRYKAAEASSFLGECFERHFDGREYLTHRCLLLLTFSSKGTVNASSSAFKGVWRTPELPSKARLEECRSAAEAFASVLESNGLMGLRRLEDKDLLDRESGRGAIADYLFLGQDCLADIQASEDSITVGERTATCYMLNRSSQFLSGEVSSTLRQEKMSSGQSEIHLSTGSLLGVGLDCEHCLNQYILVLPQQEFHRSLERRRREMASLSIGSKENELNRREIESFQEEVHSHSLVICGSLISLLVWGREDEQEKNHNAVMTAFSQVGIQPLRNTADMPCQWLSGCPGAASEVDPDDWIHMEVGSALCLWPLESFQRDVPGGSLRLCDRHRLIPVRTDIHQTARTLGWVGNYNSFLFGPSGSGKSFFINKLLEDTYEQGADIFVMDVGDSYEGLCSLIHDESLSRGGSDGVYYAYDPARPFCFNPFKDCRHWFTASAEFDAGVSGISMLIAILRLIWKSSEDDALACRPWTAVMTAAFEVVITSFVKGWEGESEPLFDDFIAYWREVIWPEMTAGRFIINGEVISSEPFAGFLAVTSPFCTNDKGEKGQYQYLLNSKGEEDIFKGRFTVFEVDKASEDKKVFPIWLMCIMRSFEAKMRSSRGFKLLVIDEAWKAIDNEQMAAYINWLWRTARKFNTGAIVVTQQLEDVVSSKVIKNSIINNSDVKIILDQSRNRNNFDGVMSLLGLKEHDRDLILSLCRDMNPRRVYREAFIGYAMHESAVYAYEVSKEEAAVFESVKEKKAPLMELAQKVGAIEAVRRTVNKH